MGGEVRVSIVIAISLPEEREVYVKKCRLDEVRTVLKALNLKDMFLKETGNCRWVCNEMLVSITKEGVERRKILYTAKDASNITDNSSTPEFEYFICHGETEGEDEGNCELADLAYDL